MYRDPERWDRSYGKGGKLERIGGTRYEYDADGQLVAKIAEDGKRWGYAWDHAGQLCEVTRPDGEKVTFAHDPLGRRVRKTFAGKTTGYVWDGNDLVHEITEGRETVTWEMEPGTFAPLAKIEGNKRYGVVTDHLGTPRLLVDEAGDVAWKAKLDIYGLARQDVTRTGCPWRWPGQYEDEETGLYYNRFRYYDPEAGRYISQDPIGLHGGFQAYGYVHDPLTWVDALGLVGACGSPGDLLEKEVEARLNAEGIPILKRDEKIFDAAGVLKGDVDFEVQQAIIEVTVSESGKLVQINKYLTPLFNPLKKAVILFAPRYSRLAEKDIVKADGQVVKTLDGLIALVK